MIREGVLISAINFCYLLKGTISLPNRNCPAYFYCFLLSRLPLYKAVYYLERHLHKSFFQHLFYKVLNIHEAKRPGAGSNVVPH